MSMTILAVILLVYGVLLLFFGFTRNQFTIRLTKLKFGRAISDAAAIRIMYIFGLLLIVAGVVIAVLA